MIKNERQYRITKAQAEKLHTAIQKFTKTVPRRVHPVLRKAQLDALKSQVADLQRELAEYERLHSGKRKIVALRSLEELPKTLIQARIARGLSQEELAVRFSHQSGQAFRSIPAGHFARFRPPLEGLSR